jgi:hypothetical protein
MPRLRPHKEICAEVRTAPPPIEVEEEVAYPAPKVFDPPCTPKFTPLGVGMHMPPRDYAVQQLLEQRQLQQLWRWLPPRERIKNAHIVYCTSCHGRSLQTLYGKALRAWQGREGKRFLPAPECVLLVKTTQGDVLGAYLTHWPQPLTLEQIQKRGSLYLGGGESFVFAFPLDGEPVKCGWSADPPTNSHFLSCTRLMLSVGDGALSVDMYLERVSSRASSTFKNTKGLLVKEKAGEEEDGKRSIEMVKSDCTMEDGREGGLEEEGGLMGPDERPDSNTDRLDLHGPDSNETRLNSNQMGSCKKSDSIRSAAASTAETVGYSFPPSIPPPLSP